MEYSIEEVLHMAEERQSLFAETGTEADKRSSLPFSSVSQQVPAFAPNATEPVSVDTLASTSWILRESAQRRPSRPLFEPKL